MNYIIKAAPMASEAEHVPAHAIRRRIDELSGRVIGAYIIAQLAKNPDRDAFVYVAAARNAPAVEAFGVRGFVVGRDA